MVFARIIADGALVISLGAALLAAGGWAGARNGWLDVINCFAPSILALALIGAALSLWAGSSGPAQWTALALSGFAAAHGLARTAPEYLPRRTPRPTGAGEGFVLISANVWHDNPTPGLAIADILAKDADAVLLQEAGGVGPAIERLHERYPYAHRLGTQGLIILVKRPITARGRISGLRRNGELLCAWIETTTAAGRPIILATTHFTWPFPPRPQAAQRRALGAALAGLPARPMILTGDFNTTPWSFAMARQDAGLSPLTRQTRALFSWPSRLAGFAWPAPILPIDHVYTSRHWAPKHIERFRIAGSDHFGVQVALSLEPGEGRLDGHRQEAEASAAATKPAAHQPADAT